MKRIAALALALVAACSGDDGPSRSDAMAALAADAGAQFGAFSTLAGDMSAAVDAACAAPSEATVAGALEQVRLTRASWLRSQATWTGPVMDRRSAGIIDWPVDIEGITALVEGVDSAELTPETIAGSVGADVRGLRSIENVLARDDAVELLGDPRWCAYLTSVATTIEDEAIAIEAAWTTGVDGEPPFAEVVADADEAQAWLSMFVDDNVQLVRLVGRPVSTEEQAESTDPLADREGQLTGVEEVFVSVGALLDDELNVDLTQQLVAAKEALRAGDAEAADELVTELDQMLSTDVAGQLDVTIGFSDADGDGSG